MISIEQKADPVEFNPDIHTNIRGFPRLKEHIKEVESRIGGTLVTDLEPDLILSLDRALFKASKELGHYPDLLVLPSDMSNYYMPIPFEVNFLGVVMKSFKKPAWFRIKRGAYVPRAPWK